MPLALTIGGITLQSFEIPEGLESIGTKQLFKKREFPGGTITIRNLGAFPLPVMWHGYLTGPTAMARLAQLRRLAATGQSVQLTYGSISWQGEVTHFSGRPRHQYLVPYTINFEPTKDLSGIGTVPQGSVSPETQLSTQQTALTAQQNGTATPLPS